MILPANSIDNHCHVLTRTHSVVPGARYAPFEASVGDYADHLSRMGLHRGVLVTASVYGINNAPMLEALRDSDCDLRGIAVVGREVGDRELGELHAAGVCGLRLQDRFVGGTPLDALVPLGDRIAELGWHLEVWTDITEHVEWLPDAIRRCRVPVVIDHMGYFAESAPLGDQALDAMIDLARDGDAWITLSGAYRLNPDFPASRAGAALAPRVQRLLDAVPDHLLWGSDWPYVAPPHGAPTQEELLAELDNWFAGDEGLLANVAVANNSACYGFARE